MSADMRPKIELLSQDLINRIIDEAFQLLMKPGIKVLSPDARKYLAEAGAEVKDEIAHIPEAVARKALETVPREFHLYDQMGEIIVPIKKIAADTTIPGIIALRGPTASMTKPRISAPKGCEPIIPAV